jgi:hypothetical protein
MRTATYFHCSLKPISRGDGKSVVNCAAYRTGSKLEDEHYGQTRDYTHKKDVVTSFTVAPGGAAEWASDTEALWNAVEKKENRKNSILAYEFEVALPNELDDPERENIARNIAGWLKDEYGVAVTAGIHNGGDRGNGKNDHAHIFMTTREFSETSEDGWAKNKFRDFNVRKGQPNPNVEHVREQVAEFINTALADAGSDERVTPESYAARGIDIEGTKHLGPKAWALGEESDRGRINREIIESRLAWQAEIEPQITANVERDLSARFGDTHLPAALADDASDLPVEQTDAATDAIPPDHAEAAPDVSDGLIEDDTKPLEGAAADDAPTITPDWTEARAGQFSDERERFTRWERLAAVVRGYWGRFVDLVQDEQSGSPVPQQEADAPDEQVAPDAGSEEHKSWVARVTQSKAAQAATRLWHGWGHRDASEFTAGLKDTAAIVEDILAKGPRPAPGPRQPGAAEAAPQEQAKQPDVAAPVEPTPSAPAPPLEDWERFHHSAHAAPEPEADAPGWERFNQSAHAKPEADAPKPTPPAPEPEQPGSHPSPPSHGSQGPELD